MVPLNCSFADALIPSSVPTSLDPASPLSSEAVSAPVSMTIDGIRAELSHDKVENGTLVLVTVQLPKTGQTVTGAFDSIKLPFYENSEAGSFTAILGVPFETKPGPNRIKITVSGGGTSENSSKSFEIPFEIKEGAYPSEVLKVDKRRVHPKRRKDIAQSEADWVIVTHLYKRITQNKYWQGPFVLPIQSAVTSQFGNKRVYNGELLNYHTGLDLRAPLKTPVFSGAGGEVVLAKSLFYTGYTVILDHGYGIFTVYCHMTKIKVKIGQIVKAHQLLGLSGKTGRVTGPHLHWGAIVHGIKINPLGLIKVLK